MTISFFVDGLPRAKQSFRASRNGGGYQPARLKAWQSEVGWAGQQAMRGMNCIEPMDGNLTVELIFFLPDLRRVDLDNLSKAVQDGLNGIVWEDDRQNIRLVLDKYVCHEKQGVWVSVQGNPRKLEIKAAEMPIVVMESAA